MMKFTRAIVRPPCATFANGLTNATLGKPDLAEALRQHAAYCAALQRCGLTLMRLDADDHFPDSTFVEDPAVLTNNLAILTNPGAPSRNGEVAGIAAALAPFYSRIARIEAPGTLDGGDICQADDHFFIGLSERTNPEGARQLSEILSSEGFTSSILDIRKSSTVLHLKTGMTYLGDRHIVAMEEVADHPAFADYDVIRVAPDESYAANLLRINDYVILADGYPGVAAAVADLGHAVVPLNMSEFRKMDGSLTCLSLRF
jgi:dimethylargininase